MSGGTIPPQETGGRVLTLEVCEMNIAVSARTASKILIADDDPCVLRAVADRCVRMGFDVETASNGLQVLIKAAQWEPDVLLLDVHMPEVDGLSALAYLRNMASKPLHVMVATGNPGREIAETCDGFDVSCIKKGRHFWTELETSLLMIYPERVAAIRRSKKGSALPEIRKRPRVLLVDDDIDVKKLFFHHFEKLGAELLYASDGVSGYWKARRQEPNVIVADYCMPNGGAEYLLDKLRTAPETKSIPVVVQSGRRLNDGIRRRLREQFCGQPGAARILQKSFDARELFEVLHRLCGFTSNLDGEAMYR
jgi:CheY-like chemotaxis protein